MSAAPKMAPASQTPPRRSFHRFPINVPLDVIVLRSGIPDSLPGRCVDLSEDGVGAVVAGELCIGQQIGIEFRLPNVGVPVRARVVVRYHDQLRCGLQFLGLSSEQIGMIQYWRTKMFPYRQHATGLRYLEWLRSPRYPRVWRFLGNRRAKFVSSLGGFTLS